jgi:hypothetical protein
MEKKKAAPKGGSLPREREMKREEMKGYAP